MSYLKGKTVYLTGASKGIGRAMAIRLAIDGAVLAICGRDRKALDDVESEILKQGAPRPFIGTFDLREEKEILHFYRGAREQLGAPDMLINNAGYNFRKVPLWEVGTEDFDNMLSVNLRAPFIIMREAFPDMKKKGSGHIVNILSTVCLFDNENMSVYTAAKKGFEGLTNVFRKEARPFNIRVTSIYPGGVDTGFRAKPRYDYMNPASVAEAIAGVLNAPEDVVVHHFTFRPMVETNF